jgi:hypothetical protein
MVWVILNSYFTDRSTNRERGRMNNGQGEYPLCISNSQLLPNAGERSCVASAAAVAGAEMGLM